MCSIQEDDLLIKAKEEQDEKDSKSGNSSSHLCKKCQTVEHIITLRKKDSYCESCFVSNCLHKFRSTLGKNKAIARNERVLVVYEGGASSTALLHLLNSGFEEPSAKKVVYTPIFLIIKRSLDPQESLNEVIEHASRYSFETHVLNIEAASLDPESITFDSKASGLEEGLLDGAKDTGGRQYLFKRYWDRAIQAAGLKLKCTKVLTSDSATDCAVSLLSGIAQGRGMNVAQDVAFSEEVSEDLRILRPMREFSRQEIEFYNAVHGLSPPFSSHSRFDGVEGESIQKLCENFVVGLQDGYPATIPTIFRTGDKLSSSKGESGNKCCLLCNGTLDTGLNKPCSLQATRFSELLSQEGAKLIDVEGFLSGEFSGSCGRSSGENGCCGEGDGECQSFKLGKSDIERELCYSCRVNLSDTYPDHLIHEAKRKVALNKMKDDIKDFLL